MSLSIKSPMRILSATAIAFLAATTPTLGAQVLKPGLQPGLTRAPDSARKISLNEAIRMADQNAPAAVQAEGVDRTRRAATASAIGAIIPCLPSNARPGIQYRA